MSARPTKRDFKKGRAPVRGKRNPQPMHQPFWEWCVRNGMSAYQANLEFGGPDSMSKGPCWCFDRMGQASVELPGGKTIYLGGEHEDHYDPDFYIYNDLVIVDDEEVKIFGYPERVFPPTDFHSASWVENSLVLIGNLGYPETREIGKTQVLQVDLDSFKISKIATGGESPGWIHSHSASLANVDSSIVISGGNRCVDRIVENFDDYQLCLKTWQWTRLTKRNWKSWILERDDEEPNQIWQIRSESWNREMGISADPYLDEAFAGLPPDVIADLKPQVSDGQMELVKTLYQSPFDHTLAIEDEERYGRYRFQVGDVTVRMDECMYGVTVAVEGTLRDAEIDQVLNSLVSRLSRLEETRYSAIRIESY